MSKKNGKIWDVIIIGAGASGIMAAITAANASANVLLIEQKEQIGKKILATGNGKCNFTNENMEYTNFRGDLNLVQSILTQYSKEDTISFFHGLGIFPRNKNGYYYPNSGQASSVLSALNHALEAKQVTLALSETVLEIEQVSYGFLLQTSQNTYKGKTIIFATGLLATPKLGSNGSAFSLIKKLGHHFMPIVPALCGFYCEGTDFKKISGVRTDARVTLFIDGEKIAKDCGELQITDYGLSGIPIFQISRYASMGLYYHKQVNISIHFLPYMSEESIMQELDSRIKSFDASVPVVQMLNGLLNSKLIPAILKMSNIPLNTTVNQLNKQKIMNLYSSICDFTVSVIKARDYEFAQVCAGGIDSTQINPNTLESLLIPGVFFAGELLDVDGICGGYNLQWAWSSGYVAAKHATMNKQQKE